MIVLNTLRRAGGGVASPASPLRRRDLACQPCQRAINELCTTFTPAAFAAFYRPSLSTFRTSTASTGHWDVDKAFPPVSVPTPLISSSEFVRAILFPDSCRSCLQKCQTTEGTDQLFMFVSLSSRRPLYLSCPAAQVCSCSHHTEVPNSMLKLS